MITSKQILELYKSSKKTSSGELVVFENPTQKELREVAKWTVTDDLDRIKVSKINPGYIRFLADAKVQKVYVWNAWLGTHDDGRRLLGYGSQDDFMKKPWVMDGMGTVTKSGVTTLDTNDMDLRLKVFFRGNRSTKVLPEFLKYNWSWVDKYIGGFGQYWSRINNK